jgi:hypothetical protein
VVVGVIAALLAGFGIGALRPLGPRSELLLLPFAPWLFVGTGPLALRQVAAGLTADRTDALFALVPPTRLSIPALFVFALLFRGQRDSWRTGARTAGAAARALLPVLPMAALVAGVTWLMHAQDLLWQFAGALAVGHRTGPVAVLEQVRLAAADQLGYGLALPPLLAAALLAAAVALQLGYLDRVTLRLGGPEPGARVAGENGPRDEARSP